MLSLSKYHPIYVSKVAVLHNLEQSIITRSVHKRIQPTKEVVKPIKKTIILST